MKTIMTALFMLFFAFSIPQSFAKSKSIAGNWKGGGSFITSSGTRERARCNANIRAQKSNRYAVFARCSLPSIGTIDQTGMVKRIGKNRFRGTFSNFDYDIHGSINIRLKGNRQVITLRSPGGRGSLVLRRRR